MYTQAHILINDLWLKIEWSQWIDQYHKFDDNIEGRKMKLQRNSGKLKIGFVQI